jgi:LmbE family N-acetylglucosaminyl deacetylase/SAM-dependent methyltransferase
VTVQHRTPGFDHRDAATPVAQWQRVLNEIEEEPFAEISRLIVLAAHPDDETLGAGTLIAEAAARKITIDVVIATDGERSHPDSPTHDPDRLAGIRRDEARAAVALLAPAATLTFLGLPDANLAEHLAELATALGGIIDGPAAEEGVGSCWLLSPWSADRHPDHEACAAAAERAAAVATIRRWEYPIWLWHWGIPGGDDVGIGALHRVAVTTAAADTRARALGCYRSQSQPLSELAGDEAVVTGEFLSHFGRPYDVLIDPTWVAPAATPEYFEQLYAGADDPWELARHWYETRKRGLLLAVLPRQRFGRAFEPGCATGLLTVALADRCDQVLAVDITDRPVELTRVRVRGLANVSVSRMQIPEQWPDGRFDLIVLSEVAYYTDLDALGERLRHALNPGGVLVLCHWRHRAADHPHTAEHTHSTLKRSTGLSVLGSYADADFLLEVLTVEASSVAELDGVLS